MTSVPNNAGVRFVTVKAQYGDCFGIISRYSNSYGNALLQRYDGKLYAVYLNNGTVNGFNVSKEAW